MHQLVAYADCVNLARENMNTIKRVRGSTVRRRRCNEVRCRRRHR
jgi:hypothetical protein